MTQKANPSVNRPAEAFKTAGAIALAGGSDPGYVSPAANPSEISVQDSGIDDEALNAFAQTSSESSLDVTIDGGEAFVYGSYLAIDSSTTVSLEASTSDQTVFVGWNKDGANDVIVGLQSAFDNASDNTDKKVELFEFDTDGSGVTSVTDLREIGQFLSPDHVDIVEELGVPIYADTTTAPQVEGRVIYIDGSGAQSSGIYSHDGASYVKAGNTDEAIQDIIPDLLVASGDLSISYDDANDELELDVQTLTTEEVQDTVNSLLASGNAIDLTYDDANDTLTADVTESDIDLSNLTGDTDSISEGASNLFFTDERAQDAIGSILSGGDNVSVTYDDANGSLTVDTSALDPEEVEDQVNSLLSAGNNISFSYDDGGNTLTIDVPDGAGSGLDADTLQGDSPSQIRDGINPTYDSDEDGVVEQAREADTVTSVPPRVWTAISGSGDTTITSNTTQSGLEFADNYTVESGNTVTSGSGLLAIYASNEITINGTIDATGAGASGGSGGGPRNDGADGNPGIFTPRQSGGTGGTGSATGGTYYWNDSQSAGSGGTGGEGDLDNSEFNDLRGFFSDKVREMLDSDPGIGAGGAGGGGGSYRGSDGIGYGSGGNGSFPGGGGGGGRQDNTGGPAGDGGDGGDGGGMIILSAPTITINGSVLAEGGDGNEGEDGAGRADGGGGGGGAGGLIVLQASTLNEAGTVSTAGGTGGNGGNGGDGADGASGEILRI